MSSVNVRTTKRELKNTTHTTGVKCLKRIKNISEYVLLKNGLRLLYVRVAKSPTVTTTIVYNVGSKDEGIGETGLTHMLEHMLFKPTSGAGPKWKDLEDSGALMNATTWLDRTLYYFTMPSEYVSDMLSVEADRMRNLILTDDEFLPERANVLSEYEMYNSQPEMALERDMCAAAFQLHGYHHETIGFKSDIESYTTDKLRSFYNKYYWPNNATLIVAGDLSDDMLLKLVKRHFGAIHKLNETPTRPNRPEPLQEGLRRVSLTRPTPLRVINIAFKAPPFTDRSWTALQIALSSLTGGETSPLHTRLVDTNKATSVSTNLYPTKDPFLAFITVYAADNVPYNDIEAVVMEEVSKLAKHPLPARKLALLKEELYSTDLFMRDGTHAVATQLAEYVATGRWERYFEQIEEVRDISAKEVSAVAAKYLSFSQATIGTLEPPV